jgi:membrane protein
MADTSSALESVAKAATQDVKPRRLFTRAFAIWWDAGVFPLSAALAYYTLFSFVPLLITLVSITGFFVGVRQVEQLISVQIGSFLGSQGQDLIATALSRALTEGNGFLTTAVSLGIFLVSGLGAFAELRRGANIVWDATPKETGLRAYSSAQIASFLAVLLLGFMLVLSLVLSAVFSFARQAVPGALAFVSDPVISALQFLLPLTLTVLLFIFMFRVLPAVRVRWRAAITGGLATAVLFTIGRIGLGYYIAASGSVSVYGAAGSLVALLLWIYYTGLIIYFGMALSRALQERRRR